MILAFFLFLPDGVPETRTRRGRRGLLALEVILLILETLLVALETLLEDGASTCGSLFSS